MKRHSGFVVFIPKWNFCLQLKEMYFGHYFTNLTKTMFDQLKTTKFYFMNNFAASNVYVKM